MKRKPRRFTNEQISKANTVNILSYAESVGYEIKKISGKTYKIPGYGGLWINAEGNKWNCFSKGTGGGIVQFVMELEGRTWVEAIKHLIGAGCEEIGTKALPRQVEPKERGELILPKKNKTYKHIFAYLIKTRKIDKDVVKQFVESKKLYEDTNRNCVFVGYDEENKAKYASVRGTNTNKQFRRDIENSDKGYPFCQEGTSDTLLIFESAIDLMSYLTLLKIYEVEEFNHHMISMSGMSYLPIEKYLERYPEICKITLCLDSDEEGEVFSQGIAKRYRENYQINRHTPKEKDFNEELLSVNNENVATRLNEESTLTRNDLVM